MSDLGNRLKELRGSQSQREMADPLGIKYQQWAKYERGEVAPGADMLKQICLVHACSADWLLGLREDREARSGPQVTATGGSAVSLGSGNAAVVKDCSKCKLMAAHIREITGRG